MIIKEFLSEEIIIRYDTETKKINISARDVDYELLLGIFEVKINRFLKMIEYEISINEEGLK